MDSIILFPPGASGAGSQLQLGTYLMADPGANYGAQGLLQSLKSANALSDGGRFGFRYAPVRQMALPLLLRDVPGQTLLQTETLLRRWTTPGAYVALQPETIPSGQAVFFDILDGRWEPDYSTFENRAGRRRGTLFLDTQPFGYWPTEILLASSASQGFMGQLAVNGAASVIGDVPPLAHVQINPTCPSVFLIRPSGSQIPVDMAAVSLGARPSFNPFIPPAVFAGLPLLWGGSAGGQFTPALAGDPYAPASQALIWGLSAGVTGTNVAKFNLAAWSASSIPSALEPAYRGRFRLFSFWKALPISTNASVYFQMIVDTERAGYPSTFNPFMGQALASANQLATLGVATDALNSFNVPSNAYQILDQGEITLPPQASGVQGGLKFRVWVAATAGAPTSAATISFGGLYLLPVDGAAGIVTRGGGQPSLANFQPTSQAQFDFNLNFTEQMLFVTPGLVPPGSSPQIMGDGRAFYRGIPLRLGASTSLLTFLTGDRVVGNGANIPAGVPISNQVFQGNVEYSQVSVSYRPTFQFLYGL